MRGVSILILLLISLAGPALAKEAKPVEDPQIDQRMQALTQQLRCLVCHRRSSLS